MFSFVVGGWDVDELDGRALSEWLRLGCGVFFDDVVYVLLENGADYERDGSENKVVKGDVKVVE